MGRRSDAAKGIAFARGNGQTAIAVLLLLVGVLLGYIALLPPAACAGCNAKVEFVFSPGAESQVVAFIHSAKETVDIEMYTFSSDVIMREIGEAEKRGVTVRVIMEPRVEDSRKQGVFNTLSALGAEVRWASLTYKLTHSKFVIVDGKKALMGSINFSKSALNDNREADVEIESAKVGELAAVFEEDWQKASEAPGGAQQGAG